MIYKELQLIPAVAYIVPGVYKHQADSFEVKSGNHDAKADEFKLFFVLLLLVLQLIEAGLCIFLQFVGLHG